MKFLLFIVIFLISGCAATIEDFRKMSAYERANYVCERHRQIAYLNSQINIANRAVSEAEHVLSQGYRVHKHCKKVPVVIPGYVRDGNTQCYNYGYSVSCNTTQYVQESYTQYETVCEEAPVSIDSELEKEKLNNYQNILYRYRDEYLNLYDQCQDDVNNLSAKNAFQYYSSVK